MRLGTLVVLMMTLAACGQGSDDQPTDFPEPTPPETTGLVLVRVLSRSRVPLANVEVVSSWQQFILDRATTDADGWAPLAVTEGSDVSAYYRNGDYRTWSTVAGVVPGELVRVTVVSFAEPTYPTATVHVLKPAGTTVAASLGHCPLPSPVAVNTTMDSYSVSLRFRCLQDDGTGSVAVSAYSSPSKLYAVALDLGPGGETTITMEPAVFRSVVVALTNTSALFQQSAGTLLRPMRKGWFIAPGADGAAAAAGTYEIEDTPAADGQSFQTNFFDSATGWNQLPYLQTGIADQMTVDGDEFSLPVTLTMTTTGIPSICWAHPAASTLPDWIQTGIFWTDDKSMWRTWRVMLHGGEQTVASMPPTPEDLLDFRIEPGATDFETGMVMWNFDVPLMDGAAAWIGPRPANHRLAVTSFRIALF